MPRRDPTLTSWTAVAVCERLCAAREGRDARRPDGCPRERWRRSRRVTRCLSRMSDRMRWGVRWRAGVWS